MWPRGGTELPSYCSTPRSMTDRSTCGALGASWLKSYAGKLSSKVNTVSEPLPQMTHPSPAPAGADFRPDRDPQQGRGRGDRERAVEALCQEVQEAQGKGLQEGLPG